MTARTRRASPPVACAHHGDVRDCGTCVAAAHEHSYQRAKAGVFTVHVGGGEEARQRLDDALAARAGHAVLHENGIVHIPTCSPRCELPEVRGR